MKDALKLLGILFWGLLTAVIIYPFLHESGHTLAAFLIGAKVVEFNLIPLPNVLCNMANISNSGIVFIGLNGMMLPIISAVILKLFSNGFWLRYISFILNGISLLASIISIVAIIAFYFEMPMLNEDVTQTLEMYPNSIAFIFIFMIAVTVYLIIRLKIDKPIEKCLAYFEITKIKTDIA